MSMHYKAIKDGARVSM